MVFLGLVVEGEANFPAVGMVLAPIGMNCLPRLLLLGEANVEGCVSVQYWLKEDSGAQLGKGKTLRGFFCCSCPIISGYSPPA